MVLHFSFSGHNEPPSESALNCRDMEIGTGTPAYEVRAVVRSFTYGIPDAWVGIDESDPPTFESQASYLKRHGCCWQVKRNAQISNSKRFNRNMF